jgi:hypothetical protein
MIIRIYMCAYAAGVAMAVLPSIDWSSPIVHLIGFWVFSAIAQSLPEPGSSKLYQFFFRFVNLIGSNLQHAGITTPQSSSSAEKNS